MDEQLSTIPIATWIMKIVTLRMGSININPIDQIASM